jgi:hypothetical protein
MNKPQQIIFPLQAFGLGDILFCQHIARQWLKTGAKIIWGVDSYYVNIGKHFPDIIFIDKKHLAIDYNIKHIASVGNIQIIPLRWANEILELPYKDCMKAKYMLMGLDWQDWNKFSWLPDKEAESKLYYEVLQLKENEQYNFISHLFRGDQSGMSAISVDNGLRNVYLTPMSEFTLIDWSMVIMRATNIHAVGSAINYLMEMLPLNAKEVHLYPRKPEEKDFRNYDYILRQHKYIFHV